MSNRAVILTISDRVSRGEAQDQSGPAILERLPLLDAVAIHREVVADEIERIRAVATTWIDRCELLVTTGGTGIAPRDVTPEALAPLVQRPLPGFGEVMRLRAFERLATSIVSRGGAGVSGGTLIVWLPGSPRAVRECLEWLAPAIKHTCAMLRGETGH
ncbi:MAG: MogA/MoaB family molybdenum cofactor biosynthesis protein [Phycisphaerae bacterium]|nr:MogA/MoaB family molybdenum cofactor biosynthesis protein [Phycisphaerae bacterium]MCZ2398787.1 MogA/MoaB family molybdenum cofactor biosynthesis protein [Phycisphaerae bacterium]